MQPGCSHMPPALFLIRLQTIQMSLNSQKNKIMTDSRMNQTVLTPIMMSLIHSLFLRLSSAFWSLSCHLLLLFSPLIPIICIISFTSPLSLCQLADTLSLLEQGIDKKQTNSRWNSNNALQQCHAPDTRTDSFFFPQC